jgi:hypothetical protein
MALTFSNGVEKWAYNYRIEIVNVDTGETCQLDEAGTITFTNLSDTVVETATAGRELSLFFPGDLGTDSPGARSDLHHWQLKGSRRVPRSRS